jgi:ribose 5-phosphate isomerase B
MKILIGSDHGGYTLKEDLKQFLQESGYQVLDFGTHSPDPVDYPDIAFLVADAVRKDPETVGIILDGAGIGSAIVANKVPGIRAAVCSDLYTARNSKEHNDANVLTLGGRVLGPGLAREIVKTWLSSSFLEARQARRVKKILEIENRYLKS